MLTFLIFCYYYLFLFRKALKHKHNKRNDIDIKNIDKPISIVVVLKNEADYIENVLPLLLNQEYNGNYQVVVVNDGCEDEAIVDTLEKMAESHKNLYVTNIKKDHHFHHTNKLAITIGIKAATHPNILLTTTAATPKGRDWLKYMSAGFTGEHSIVTGYAIITKNRGNRNRISRVINILDSLLSLSMAVEGLPYKTASSSNMGFTSNLFFYNKGYFDYLRFNSGDNDLFIQRVAPTSDSVGVILHQSASVTIPQSNYGFSSWYAQRKHDTYAKRYYPFSVRLYLGMLPLTSLFFWITAIYTCVTGDLYLRILSVLLILFRIIIIILTTRKLAIRTGDKIPYLTFLAYDIWSFFDNLILSILRRLKPSKSLWI